MGQRSVGWKSVSRAFPAILLAMLSACGGVSNSKTIITPPPPTLTSVSISPSDPSIVVGKTIKFTATAGYSDGSKNEVTNSATWVSSDPSATIQPNGVATGVKPGSPNIQATFGGITGLTVLEITTTAVQNGLTLGQLNPFISPGATLQLIAVAKYADGSTQTVTSTAAWTSNAAAATVETNTGTNPGMVTGVSAGSATITASSGGFQASTTVTVDPSAQTVPLMDMKTSGQNYLGFLGGLYGSNTNTVPTQHNTDGKTAAAAIQPLDQNGKPSSKGAVVFLGIGMSNATIEFSNFVTTAGADAKVNHTNLAIEDGAHGAVTACPWTVAAGLAGPVCGATGVPAENQYDRVRDTVLTTAVGAPGAPAGCGTTGSPCLTEAQVQVIWMKNANPQPGVDGIGSMSSNTDCVAEVPFAPKFKTEACRYEWQTGEIVRAAKSRYPNLKQIFFSTRIYAGYAPKPLNPEPYAYEYGFSGQWLVEAQINQISNGTVDTVAGNLDYTTGAWLAWSSYLWANGTNPRSDGLIWCNGQTGAPCSGEQDFEPDGTHPSGNNPGHDGASKIVSGQPGSQFNGLMGFFKTSPYTSSWFCASKTSCP